MTRALALAALLVVVVAVALAGCEPPPVFAGADKRQSTESARIEGTVVVSTAARGNVVLFLFDAARPPPPTGTGRPLAFTVLTEKTVFGAAAPGDTGPFTAPFAFSLVGAGNYLVRGFVDANADFIPWYAITSEVNRGDVGGAAVTPSLTPRTVTVALDGAGDLVPALDVRVMVGDSLKVPFDRPAFEVQSPSSTLPASGLRATLVATTLAEPLVVEHSPGFLTQLGDAGVVLWPKVAVRKLAEGALLHDENDLDKNGVLDLEAGFADYEHVNPTTGATIAPDGAPDLVVLKAGFDPTGLPLVDDAGSPLPSPVPIAQLPLLIAPVAYDLSDPARPAVLKSVPPGRYAITVIQFTGQTWRMPNELAPALAADRGFREVASQGFVLEVP